MKTPPPDPFSPFGPLGPLGPRSRFAGLVAGLRRAAVLVGGGSVLMVGIAMIVLPGPALVVIPAGLGILALEFLWARRLLVHLRRRFRNLATRARDARSAHKAVRDIRRLSSGSRVASKLPGGSAGDVA